MTRLTSDYTLKQLADFLSAASLPCDVHGDEQVRIFGIGTLQTAKQNQISFLANSSYEKHLPETQAGAVILAPEHVAKCPTNALILKNPYLAYARLSHLFDAVSVQVAGVHPSAVVADGVQLDPSASVGASVTIETGARIGAGVILGAGAYVGQGSTIGANTRVWPNASIYHGVTIGQRCIIHSGAVIGSDGFGFANAAGQWVKIAQVGGVRIGDDVEIGANTVIDRGALDDTEIGDGVKLDNQIQIAHNVQIGDHSVIAACVGIAGSTKIGKHCVFGGGSGIGGHLTIADQVQLTGMTMVTHSLTEAGVYSSGTGVEPNTKWRKSVVRFRQLDDMAKRLKEMEKLVAQLTAQRADPHDAD